MVAAIEQGMREEGVDLHILTDPWAPNIVSWDCSSGTIFFDSLLASLHVRTARRDLTVPLDDPKCFEKVAAFVRGIPPIKGR
jgi:hypothetical protein